jgi:hypothetical protein
MATAEQIERAEWELDRATAKLSRAKPSNGAGAEASYGQAYNLLVQLGARPVLRKKYRVYTG